MHPIYIISKRNLLVNGSHMLDGLVQCCVIVWVWFYWKWFVIFNIGMLWLNSITNYDMHCANNYDDVSKRISSFIPGSSVSGFEAAADESVSSIDTYILNSKLNIIHQKALNKVKKGVSVLLFFIYLLFSKA